MRSPNAFWLRLHELSTAYEAEGLTADERMKYVIKQLMEMAPTEQRRLLQDLSQLLVDVSELYPEVFAVVCQRGPKPQANGKNTPSKPSPIQIVTKRRKARAGAGAASV
jgi:hypothetical protein